MAKDLSTKSRRSVNEVSAKEFSTPAKFFFTGEVFLRPDIVDYFYLKFNFNIFCKTPFPTPKNIKQADLNGVSQKKLKLN